MDVEEPDLAVPKDVRGEEEIVDNDEVQQSLDVHQLIVQQADFIAAQQQEQQRHQQDGVQQYIVLQQNQDESIHSQTQQQQELILLQDEQTDGNIVTTQVQSEEKVEEHLQQTIETTEENMTGTAVQIDNALYEAIKIDESAIINPSPSNTSQHIIEIDGQQQMVTIGDNQHIIIFAKQFAENIEQQQQQQLVKPAYEIECTTEGQPFQRYLSYEEFKREMTEYENTTITKFVLRNQSKQFQREVCIHDIILDTNKSSELPLIRWEFCGQNDLLPMPFMGIPYISVGKQVFQCHQGKDYNTNKKQAYELRKEILNQATRFQIKSRNKGPSKKLDCPVIFAVRKMYFFPEYQLEEDSKRGRGIIAQKIRSKLFRIKKQKCNCHLKSEEDENLPPSEQKQNKQNDRRSTEVIGRLEYLTKFPLGNQHNHDGAKAANFMKLQLKKHGTKGVEIMQSKKPAEANPYEYDKHIELIKALRLAGDLDDLRVARENMSKIYPLSEDLWLAWFEDELPLSVIPEQKEFLVSKFELAVKDYASVKIWNEYCQYMMNNIESPADIERARDVFERAITAVGLHVTEGSCIWDGYREFEIAILDSYQQLQDSGDTVGMDAKVQSQIEKIAAIFRRQLSVPLLGMEDTFKIFDDWQAETISGETRRAHQKALTKLESCMEFEEKLVNAAGSKYPEYLTYIDHEIKEGDPGRIQCIFERAIKDNCLQYELWEKYTRYLDFKLKINDISLDAHERAIRNCPWVSSLWMNYLRALERSNADHSKYKEVFNQSLKGGFSAAEGYLQVWVENCDYHRRRISDWSFEEDKVDELHKAYEGAITYMSNYFGLEGDRRCVLLREWALIEAKYLQNVKRAQELWDTVMKKHNRDCSLWLDYIHFLMLYADVLTVRRVFQRAVQITLDAPEKLCESFIKFERQYGTLVDVDDACQKVEVLLQRVKEKKEKENLKDNQLNNKPVKKKKENEKDESWSKKKKRKQKEKESLKRTFEEDDDDSPRKVKVKKFKDDTEASATSNAGAKQPTFVAPTSIPDVSTKNKKTANKNISKNESRVKDETMDTTEKLPVTDLKEQTKKDNGDDDFDPNIEKVDYDYSVFLSNMLFTVDDQHVRTMFQKCGEIETIRIVRNLVGKSKGFAYLQFKTKERHKYTTRYILYRKFESSVTKHAFFLPIVTYFKWKKESVEEALKLDRESLLDRPVFVSKCVDKQKNPTQFKFPTGLDKHTLYVSNLPFELSSDELTQHFNQCGVINQVRLVTNRSGKSKGYAYVEYKNEADAATAILKLDKTTLNNRPINVALSNPPSRKPTKETSDGKTKFLGAKPKMIEVPGSRARSRTQVSFVPSAVLKNQTHIESKKTTTTTTAIEKSETTETAAETTNTTAKMKNDDFRRFLTK